MPEVAVTREIAPSAQVAAGAVVGPYCVVGPHATVGAGTVLSRRVTLLAHTTLGRDNLVGEGCVLGADPQDLKYAGGDTRLVVGSRNRLGREVTLHIGTEAGGGLTRVGDDNFLMDGCHVAHDCYVDDRVVLGRSTLLAGHIRVQTGAVIEDLCGLHHFVTIGRFARVGAHTPVRRDVPPFTFFRGPDHDIDAPPAVRGVHDEGIAAAGLSSEEEKELRYALGELFDDEAALQNKIEQLANLGVEGEAALLCEFCTRSLKGVYGRYRELLRGQVPPETAEFASPDGGQDPRRSPT
jgi:UDP-N-acetylglucosamine acyltransferase